MKNITANQLLNYLVKQGSVDRKYSIEELELALEQLGSKVVANNTEDVEAPDRELPRIKRVLRKVIVKHTSVMLDNPDDIGIYPTTNFYSDLQDDIETLIQQEANRQKAEMLDRLQEPSWKDDQTRLSITKSDYYYSIEAERKQLEEKL